MIDWTLDNRAIATVRLTRGAARNAIPLTGWAAMTDALDEIAARGARVVILRSGVDGIFSAGADITEFVALRHDPAARTGFRATMRGAIEALAALPIPTIAAIDGGCFGAAVAVALACDMRIAGQDARFAATPAKLGIGYPREDVARLIAQIGKGQASRMLFSAQSIDAGEAARIGLVELVARSAADAADALAGTIAANAPGAVALLKRTLADPAASRHDADFDAAFGGAEFAEALAVFLERKAR